MTGRIAFAIILLTVHGAAAQPREPERAVLPGLIVDAATAPRDARGAPDETRIRGARAWRPRAPAVAARDAELEALRDDAAASAGGADFVPVPVFPSDARAPARMDSGDPDPDRLHSPPPPPER
ncbi:hypothetical protein KF840_08090 [bacterium]|nr:hypothetical protein [bacterium]